MRLRNKRQFVCTQCVCTPCGVGYFTRLCFPVDPRLDRIPERFKIWMVLSPSTIESGRTTVFPTKRGRIAQEKNTAKDGKQRNKITISSSNKLH